jgi:L-ascorbate metabolism protein UlaG (beta-lactamase superfamily)
MKIFGSVSTLLALCTILSSAPVFGFETDTIETKAGPLKITFIGHGTLMMTIGTKTIHIDPWTKLADYTKLPKADLILVTHGHRDHLDTVAINQARKSTTKLATTAECATRLDHATVLKNGEVKTIAGFTIQAVAAYNLVHMRDSGQAYHPKGDGNGYVINVGEKRIYIAGDTENTPEIKKLSQIDIAFLPMNLPYTMTPEMVADAAIAFRPKILYPYHYGQIDPQTIKKLLAAEKDIDIRIRPMK